MPRVGASNDFALISTDLNLNQIVHNFAFIVTDVIIAGAVEDTALYLSLNANLKPVTDDAVLRIL